MHSLNKIFHPQTIACVGASDREGSVGWAVMQNLLGGNFQGEVYAVNPGHRSVWERESYPSVKKLPATVDLAVIVAPARAVLQIVKECGEAGIGGAVIISVGFQEGEEGGQRRFLKLTQLAHQYGIRLIGPNCLGIITAAAGLNASLAGRMVLPGKIAFISQSAALCTAILDWSVQQQVGFSHFVSIGEMADVDYADLIDYFGTDSKTACILIYMESLTQARKFMSAARAFSRSKPIIVLKAGISEEGAQAALLHTGSVAGNDAAFDAAFRRAGIIRVERVAQLFHVAQALAMQPLPQGNRLAIVTNAGGPAVLATDFLVKNGGQLAPLSPETMQALVDVLPNNWNRGNPVDLLGDAPAERFAQALDLVLQDKNLDGVLVIVTNQHLTNEADIARAVVEVSKKHSKPLFACWMGETDVAEGRKVLEAGQVPNYRYPESAVDVFLKTYHYDRNLQLLYETPTASPAAFSPKKEAAADLIRNALYSGRTSLTEAEGKKLLACYDIPVTVHETAHTAEDAVEAAGRIGYPVVLKIDSPDINHLTDIGGIHLGLRTDEEVERAFGELLGKARQHRPDAQVNGVLVEKMVSKKYELLVGAKKDPVFGPVIAFGLGGTAVEVFQDIRLGLPPLNMALAQRIVERTKVFQLLRGYRGQPPVDLADLQFLLVKFAYLVMDFPQIKEIDINPYAVDETGGCVLDSHIVLENAPDRQGRFPYDHLVVSPYPAEFEKKLTLRNGQSVLLRPIRPEDEALEADLFDQLSPQSIYFRFFRYIKHVSHQDLIRLTHIDYDRELAIVAEVETEGEKQLIGVVRLVNDYRNESADFAVVVADAWHGQGLGSLLMDYILDIARQRGLQKITADTLASNGPMMRMFKRRGFSMERDGEVMSVALEL